MREILFRGKRKDTGEWMENLTVLKPDNHMYMCKSSMCEITYDLQYNITAIKSKKPFFVEVIPETVGQYTGLTDRTGKKIFEGDILKLKDYHHERIVYVFWGNIGSWFYGGDGYSDEYIFNSSEKEVIGNIHDNPELLGDDEQ